MQETCKYLHSYSSSTALNHCKENIGGLDLRTNMGEGD